MTTPDPSNAQDTPSSPEQEPKAPESPEQEPTAPEPQETPENAAQEPPQAELSPEEKKVRKLRQEAARHRTSSKEARAEADNLRAQVTALQDNALAAELATHRVTLEAFKAAGAREKAFNDDGTLNRDAIAVEAKAAAARFGQIPARPSPDPHLGRETPPGPERGSRTTWADKLTTRPIGA